MTTRELLALLQRHYIKPGADLPGGIFLPEVGWNGSGPGGGAGGCDAIYVGFTTSSGRILVGHELKVSRADWLNELNKPGKSDGWADNCHQWWLVVSDPGIVHDGELPPGWGLMSPGRSKTRMQVHTAAETKGRWHHPSWVAVRSIMARQDTLRANAIAAARTDARDKARADVEKQVREAVERRLAVSSPDAALLAERLRAVETALGATIDWRTEAQGWGPHFGHDSVTLGDIAMLAGALHEARTVRQAADAIASRYANPVANTRAQLARVGKNLDALDAALTALRSAADNPTEEGTQ